MCLIFFDSTVPDMATIVRLAHDNHPELLFLNAIGLFYCLSDEILVICVCPKTIQVGFIG